MTRLLRLTSLGANEVAGVGALKWGCTSSNVHSNGDGSIVFTCGRSRLIILIRAA